MTTTQDDLTFSIIIPTYNEADDIRRTLDAVTGQRYPHKEIIVVDDSTDETTEIIGGYASRGVRLIRPEGRRGRCEARNRGIREATGSVVVLLNADVFPEPDFLDRIAEHYWRGADYVLVESKVANLEAMFPRYLQALHTHEYAGQEWIEWTEGFSCRREAALSVGLFPETPIPLCAGEDGYFGSALSRRFRKVIDRSIVVPHIMPASLREFWVQQLGRGRGTPLVRYFLERRPVWYIAMRGLVKTMLIACSIGLLLPGFRASLTLTRFSPRGRADLPALWWARTISQIAQMVGTYRGVLDVWRYDRATQPVRASLH